MSITRADVRAIDARAEADGLPTRVLMENAGRGVAEVVPRLGAGGRILICCGKGNNGGDGLVAARHLASAGADVSVLLFADPASLTGPAAENWFALTRTPIRHLVCWPFDEAILAAEVQHAAWIVDGLFGVGLSAPARPPFDRIIAMLNTSAARIVAIDLPSGLDCDTGEPLGATIRASHTVTFLAPKKGFENPKSSRWTGNVHVADLGLGRPCEIDN